MVDGQRQRDFEDQFLGQLTARTRALTLRGKPADAVATATLADGDLTVRETLARLGVYDPQVLDAMPGRRAVQFAFSRPSMLGLSRRTIARLRAQVLAPVEALVKGGTAEPVTRAQVHAALQRYAQLPRDQQPSAVVLGSPVGFAPDAVMLAKTGGSPALILVTGRADGGWEVTLPPSVDGTPWAALFEFETPDARQARLNRYLEQHGTELASTGLSVPDVAQQLGLPLDVADRLVRQACRLDPSLMTVAHAGMVSVCRSPLTEKGTTMSIWTRVRRWFGAKPTVAEQVRTLTAQRTVLEQERKGLDQQVEKLETEEVALLKQGAAAPSDAEKRQAAGKLLRLRRELNRQKALAQVKTNQIDVIGTNVHNMTLAEGVRAVALPTREVLAQQAAEAEAAVQGLNEVAEAARDVEVIGASAQSQEAEDAIFAEFAQVAANDKAAAPATATPAEPARQVSAAPAAANKSRSGPELG